MHQTPAEIFASLLPLVFLTSLPLAIGAFHLAPKMGRNRWLWAVLMLIPVINIIPGSIFVFLAIGAVLDRLNVIADRLKNGAAFS